jgi:hypothetical protein
MVGEAGMLPSTAIISYPALPKSAT